MNNNIKELLKAGIIGAGIGVIIYFIKNANKIYQNKKKSM